jgi:hypothetical protein
MVLPVMLRGRRTVAGVAAYFDLITDDGRLFYGDSFHFGYFRTGTETLAQALDAHTDLVAEMARPKTRQRILEWAAASERRRSATRSELPRPLTRGLREGAGRPRGLRQRG